MKKLYVAQAFEMVDKKEIICSIKWHKKLAQYAGMEAIIPYEQQLNENTTYDPYSIVKNDILMLSQSDAIFADISINKYEYIGTIAELVYAWLFRIPSIIYIGETNRDSRKWLIYHSDLIFKDKNKVIDFLKLVPTFSEIEKSLPSYYDDRATSYDDAYENHGVHDDPETNKQWAFELNYVKNIVLENMNGHVLDIACGTGWWAEKMVSNCAVTCFDNSDKMLQIVNSRLSTKMTHKYEIIKGNAFEPLPFEDNTFDCCFFAFWIGLLNPIFVKAFLNEVSRVTKQFGTICFFDSKIERFSQNIDFGEYGIQYRGKESKIKLYKKYYTIDELKYLLTSFSFKTELFQTSNYFIGATYCNKKIQNITI